jgi:hypothetical protein
MKAAEPDGGWAENWMLWTSGLSCRMLLGVLSSEAEYGDCSHFFELTF